MKRLRYILPFVLSLLIIYAGVGVAICHSLTCEVACASSCSTPCDSCCDDSDTKSTDTCSGDKCMVDVYKINLVAQSVSLSISIPSFQLFCVLLPAFESTIFHSGEIEASYMVPPNLGGSRHYLALYAVLLI